MSAFKARDSWWVDFRHDFTRIRKRSPLNTREGARQYEMTLRARLARGEPLEPEVVAEVPKPTFAEFSAEWMETYVKVNNKPSTLRAREFYLRLHLLPAFGDTRLDQLSANAIEVYKGQKLKEGLSPKTINEHLSTIHKCLATAVQWSRLAAVPHVTWLKTAEPTIEFLTDAECRALLAQRGEGMWWQMLVLALNSGLRLGELFALRVEDVDVEHGLITIRHNMVRGVIGTPKNNRVRHLPLTPAIAEALDLTGPRTRPLFSRVDGEPLTYRNAEYALQRLCKRAGVRPVGWHALRHTFATRLVEAGVPIRTVQALLGHATISMTERYAHVAPTSLLRSIPAIDTHFGLASASQGQPVANISTETPAQYP